MVIVSHPEFGLLMIILNQIYGKILLYQHLPRSEEFVKVLRKIGQQWEYPQNEIMMNGERHSKILLPEKVPHK